MSERLVVLVGPSGVGKTAIAAALEERIAIKRLITCTTRDPRPGEVDGRDYRFFDRAHFMWRVSCKKFAEIALVHQNLYGSLREDIDRQINSKEAALLILDVQGAESIVAIYPRAQVFFITAPIDQLMRRLDERKMNDEERKKRKAALVEELLGAHSSAIVDVVENADGYLPDAVLRICNKIISRIGNPHMPSC